MDTKTIKKLLNSIKLFGNAKTIHKASTQTLELEQDIKKEYGLIVLKKSELPAASRKAIVLIFNNLERIKTWIKAWDNYQKSITNLHKAVLKDIEPLAGKGSN